MIPGIGIGAGAGAGTGAGVPGLVLVVLYAMMVNEVGVESAPPIFIQFGTISIQFRTIIILIQFHVIIIIKFSIFNITTTTIITFT